MTVLEKKIQTKNDEQKKALNAWANNKFKGTVIAATGFGKTRVGVVAIGKILTANKEAKALVVVPTTHLQDQFDAEFIKWDYANVLDRVQILCYQSAYKLIDEEFEVVVADEIHLGLSKEYSKVFYNNKFNRILCMTATKPDNIDDLEKLNWLAPTVYEINLDKCVKLGLVSTYEIYCLPIELSEQEKIDYKKANNMFVHYKYKLGQFDAFNEAKRIIGSNNVTALEKQHAVMFYKAMRQRKAIVDFAENKIIGVRNILIKLGKTLLKVANYKSKIITFAGANDFTDRIATCINNNKDVCYKAVTYHSGMTPKKREKALHAFKMSGADVICSTKALNQGFDMPDASMAIICGLTSKSLTMIQRVGRILRFAEHKTGKIIILYIKNTQEEKWLKSAVKGLTNVNWVDDLTEILL